MQGLLGLPPGLAGFVAQRQIAGREQDRSLNQVQGLLSIESMKRQQSMLAQQQAQQQAQQAQVEAFAQTLPPEQQQVFRMDPGGFVRRMNEVKIGAPGSTIIRGGKVSETLPMAPKEPTVSPLTRLIKERDMLPQGDPNRALLDQAIAKQTSHAPAASVSVKVNNEMSKGFAKEVAPIMGESMSAASGAVNAIDTVARVRGAIDKGNVTLGPGATLRNQMDQVAQVFGVVGKDVEERLVNTRNVIRGLSQFALAARKQLKGQGQVSDYEGRLIQRAEAGEIQDFTLPELKDFLGVTEKLAKKTHDEHKRKIKIMQDSPELQQFVPFYDVASPAKQVKRTGKLDGKTVIEYTDGTYEVK